MATGIRGTGSYLPDRVVANDDLSAIVDTSDEWIVAHTGIRERRRAADRTTTSELGAAAGIRALQAANVAPEQVDAIIMATSSPDQIQPATACAVQARLGLGPVPAFDVSAASAGFVFAMATAAGLMRSFAQYRRVLVIGSEVYSRIIDYQDRGTCVFFGDGAGAAVLGGVPEGFGVLGCHLLADGSRFDVVGIPAGGVAEPVTPQTIATRRQYLRMNGRQVWEFATTALPHAVKSALASAGLGVDDIDLLIPHQANARILEYAASALGIPASKIWTTVERYGNTAGASVPITLDDAARAGRLRRGSVVVLAAVGGGMTAGGLILRWY